MPIKLTKKHRQLIKDSRKGITQTQLAALVGCAPSQISCYESGDKQPSEEMMKAIAKELGLKFKVSTVITLK